MGFAVLVIIGFLSRGMWIWGLWIWKDMECFKWDLMGHSSRNMENIGAEGDLNSEDFSYDVLVKHFLYCFAPFCPHLKTLPEANVKIFLLIAMKRESQKIPAQSLSSGSFS